jgi:chromosome segregation ATPase
MVRPLQPATGVEASIDESVEARIDALMQKVSHIGGILATMRTIVEKLEARVERLSRERHHEDAELLKTVPTVDHLLREEIEEIENMTNHCEQQGCPSGHPGPTGQDGETS